MIEPRLIELLPAVLLRLPEAIITQDGIPEDLQRVVRDIKARRQPKVFRGIPPHRYLHWVTAPAIDVANRRLNFRNVPRRRAAKHNSIGGVIREGRIKLALTQAQLAKQYGVSLRVIRDLEQGRLNASVKSVNEILSVFGRTLRV